MLLTRLVVAAIFTLGSVAALPTNNPDNGTGVEARDSQDHENNLVARHGCRENYYNHHQSRCCRYHHVHKSYYDCYYW
ncbi:hypothetical protein OCS_00570 [Ophiocordyceps sinensis CO18]|uniref:Uncharacterized protein n=1 Tax=Ophiocordyceps sinensis (strain Co18 / CGMCC 3.14243) TaxID=911162 RepID=T5AE46_OPHSC|nr:hypothetical protein OCS_00570 [Ophiocordyceps sinensis CO18]